MTIQADYAAGTAVYIGVAGNSVGCGYYSQGNASIALDGASRITDASQQLTVVRSWPTMLRELLKIKNASSDVYNVSGSGWTINEHNIQNTDTLLAGKSPKPTHCIIPCMINDAVSASWRTIAEYQADMDTLCDDLVANGIIPVIALENDIDHSVYGDNRTDSKTYLDIKAEAKAYAVANDYEIIDFFNPIFFYVERNSGVASTSGAVFDNVHPNMFGNLLLLYAVKFWLES